jgi:hypothetical protein
VSKVIDRDFIRDLGNDIQRSADAHLPGGARSAASAVQTMQGAGQSGGASGSLSGFPLVPSSVAVMLMPKVLGAGVGLTRTCCRLTHKPAAHQLLRLINHRQVSRTRLEYRTPKPEHCGWP